MVVYGYYQNDTGIGTDFYIGFKNYANITKVEYSADSFSGVYVAWFTVTYKEDSATKTINLLVFNGIIYANVSWTDNISAKSCAKTDSMLISDSTGMPIVKKSGSEMLGNDGKEGVYNNGEAYGQIHLDGYGTITVGDATGSYTVDGDKVTFVVNNAMRVVTLGDGTYTKTLDGYEGTYTLPDESTLALDGYGNVTDTSKTYVVNGKNITVYDGETSTVYGLDVENKTFIGKSKFAGLRFDKGSADYIVFDDSTDITGTMYCGNAGWYITFTGTYDEATKTLTLTVVTQSGTGASTGQQITFTVSDGQLKLNNTKPFPYVDVTNTYVYTNADFVA